MSFIKVSNLNKSFRDKVLFRNLNLEIKKGEIIVFFGANGKGKTTLLNILSGLDKEFEGELILEKKDLKKGFVFQNHSDSLFPWLNAYENVAFPFTNDNLPNDEKNQKIMVAVKKMKLENYTNNYTYELSGGFKQRVGIARAIATDPDILFFDEPSSAIDYLTTKELDIELRNLLKESKTTCIYVSHDIDEAIFMADRVLIFGENNQIQNFDIELPQKRDFSTFTSEVFFETRNKILSKICIN